MIFISFALFYDSLIMKKSILFFICCLGIGFSAFAQHYPYQNRKLSIQERVADLLSRMTLEEKIAETNLLPYYENTDSIIRVKIRAGRVGALLKANGAECNRSLQEEAMKHSRLGIPLVFHEDVIHGYRTLGPIPLAESCSWDTAMVCRSARLAAKEASASGIQLTYAPMVDVSYDPRWGRIMETSGEDAFLDAELAAARVRGFQGNSLSDVSTVAACVKHFAGYAALLAGRDYQNTDFSQRDLFERYLPAFQSAVDAGVASVMCSYTSYDGEPVTMNRFMGKDVLRDFMKFDGLYMTDWTTFNHVVNEGAATDGKEAAQRGLDAGLEMDMSSGQYDRWLKTLVEEGKADTARINKAAAHALALKFSLGLFDNPYAYFNTRRERKTVCSEEIRQGMFEMACESMVLLKNENVLPLSASARIALVGPFAGMKNDLMGAWTMKGRAEEVVSVEEGFSERLPENNLIMAGCPWNGVTEEYLNDIVQRTAAADVIVACIGEFNMHIGEGVSTGKLEIPAEQINMLRLLKQTGKPVVAVLFNGRPLVVSDILDNCDALLEAWYPGTMGGHAVAALLTGERVPSGKLSQTFPRHAGQVPIAYNFRRTFGKINHDDLLEGAQFPFGFGLSYTRFEYGQPSSDRHVYSEGDSVRVNVKVRNTGTMAGREVVQLYVRDEVASIIPREKELRGFTSVVLQPGEERNVCFCLPTEAFRIYNNRMERVLEPGRFQLLTGTNSNDLQSCEIRFE